MPYPLPDGGPPYTADLRWFLVAVPDDVAFVRAAMGAYTELTKYFMWGHEGKEPGRNEAAQVWEAAVAATLEALEMGFPDILLGHIDEVETLLQFIVDKNVCCPATGIEDVVTDWQDVVGDVIDTSGGDVVVGVGDPPPGAADWTQFQSKLCDGASKYADGLIAMVDNFAIIQGLLSGLTLATLGAFIASFLPILGVSVVAAGVVVTALGLLGKLDELQDLVEPVSGWDAMRTALTDARQDIICAIITSDTAAQAAARVQAIVEGIDSNIWAWIRFFTIPTIVMQRIFNMESDAAGGYGGGCGTCDTILPGNWVLFDTFAPTGQDYTTVLGDYSAEMVRATFSQVSNQQSFRTQWQLADCASATAEVAEISVTIRIFGNVGNGHPTENRFLSPRVIFDTDTNCESPDTINGDVEDDPDAIVNAPGVTAVDYTGTFTYTTAGARKSIGIQPGWYGICNSYDLVVEITDLTIVEPT